MPKILKNTFQYLLIIAITGILLWFSLQGIKVEDGANKFDFIVNAWNESSKTQLILMAVVALLSHYVRAVRWKMLLSPTKNNVKASNSLLSVLVGYMVNLVVPRGGEVSRCYNLYKLENTPIPIAFGTVIVERIVDVLCMLLVLILAFIIEWSRLWELMDSIGFSTNKWHFPLWATYSLIGIVIIALAIYLLRKNKKLLSILDGFKAGFFSIFKLKNRGLFVFYSIFIWILYYLMTYFTVQAFETTSHLGFSAVLTVFGLGAIAMAVPLPGGAGSYHTIVPLGLFMLYQLPKDDAIAFVFVFHAWQTFIMIVMGVVSLLITYILVKRNKLNTDLTKIQ